MTFDPVLAAQLADECDKSHTMTVLIVGDQCESRLAEVAEQLRAAVAERSRAAVDLTAERAQWHSLRAAMRECLQNASAFVPAGELWSRIRRLAGEP
jgi:hypothetical protein